MRTSNIGKHAQDEQDMNASMVSFDGNEAAAHVAYRLSEVCAIYPDHTVIDDGGTGG